ncbi:MAG TPA: 4'-phosphopantetheinyl transferase superfamily protein [Hyphomonas sp.]|nr:hypothetical protein [Hyphomonas sp.]HRJ00520.1 4'-phosphopantetheinyl transferase superfamily protein [Hyphomonas sp.]HRK67295.1 4'-phosphopantetheinyl transferase superfamily protein [Hyphomonas sp.]
MTIWTDPFEPAGLVGYPGCALGVAEAAPGRELAGVLTPAERERLARLKSDARRDELERSLVLRRELIGALLTYDPVTVQLAANENGAPLLIEPQGFAVSVSNKGLWTFVAADPAPSMIGADVEIVREIDWKAMLGMVCGDDERSAFLEALAGEAALKNFFRMWTVKEAVLKATGEGFRAGPKSIQIPAAMYGGGAQGRLHAFGKSFDVWAHQAGELALSLARRAS